jgi:hydroxyacylglutathione hydrolase
MNSLQITPVSALQTNYIWCIHDAQHCICVDPGDAGVVMDFCEHRGLKLIGALITHTHWDHVGGLDLLLAYEPSLTIWSGKIDQLSQATEYVVDEQVITLKPFNYQLKVMHVPGHTLGHIVYYNDSVLFCGDTLFSMGCGRVFEGTMGQMNQSLAKLAALPDTVLVYPGHEYTQKNLLFALTQKPNDVGLRDYLTRVEQQLAQNKPTLPSKMAEEKKLNPFLNCTNEAEFTLLRHKKDEF